VGRPKVIGSFDHLVI